MLNSIFPVVLCGGNGTRLWPVSREDLPKQFIAFGKRKSLFEETINRLENVVDNKSNCIFVLSNIKHASILNKKLYKKSVHIELLFEPCSKNTAPAIAIAAFEALSREEDPILVIFPSDQKITNEIELQNSLSKAVNLAKLNNLVTLGIPATSPETGFGYIKYSTPIENLGYKVDQFIEKPNYELACELIKPQSNCFWNAGIFVFKAKVFLEELKKYSFEIYNQAKNSHDKLKRKDNKFYISGEQFEKCPSDSIDYAVMEHAENVVVVPLKCQWADLGNWKAIYDSAEKDINGNSVIGDVIVEKTNNCYLNSQSRLVATIGLSNMAVIETDDAVLVAALDNVQDVKRVVQKLKDSNRKECSETSITSRPWGSFQSITLSDGYQVKKIIVEPNEELSLQKHFHRSEHWIVVKGTAEVEVDGKTQLVSENHSVYIPLGAVHKLKNPGKIQLVLIEIQIGPYLGEDDIVRFKDKYNRI